MQQHPNDGLNEHVPHWASVQPSKTVHYIDKVLPVLRDRYQSELAEAKAKYEHAVVNCRSDDELIGIMCRYSQEQDAIRLAFRDIRALVFSQMFR